MTGVQPDNFEANPRGLQGSSKQPSAVRCGISVAERPLEHAAESISQATAPQKEMGPLLGSGDQSTDNGRNLGRRSFDALAWLKSRAVWRRAALAAFLVVGPQLYAGGESFGLGIPYIPSASANGPVHKVLSVMMYKDSKLQSPIFNPVGIPREFFDFDSQRPKNLFVSDYVIGHEIFLPGVKFVAPSIRPSNGGDDIDLLRETRRSSEIFQANRDEGGFRRPMLIVFDSKGHIDRKNVGNLQGMESFFGVFGSSDSSVSRPSGGHNRQSHIARLPLATATSFNPESDCRSGQDESEGGDPKGKKGCWVFRRSLPEGFARFTFIFGGAIGLIVSLGLIAILRWIDRRD
jgi:hypothetical protein